MKAESKAEKPAATATPKAEAAADGMPAAETPREIAKETAKEAAKRRRSRPRGPPNSPSCGGAASPPSRRRKRCLRRRWKLRRWRTPKPEMSAPAADVQSPKRRQRWRPPRHRPIKPCRRRNRTPSLRAAEAKPEAKPSSEPVKVEAWRDSDGLRLTFSFPSLTPAASFRRGDTVWLIFDSTSAARRRADPRQGRRRYRRCQPRCRSTTGRRSAFVSTVRRCIRCPPTSARAERTGR